MQRATCNPFVKKLVILLKNEIIFFRYCSFGCSSQNSEDEDKFHETHAQFKNYQCKPNSRLKYYNTISDPVNPWFRSNGLPASKALRDDRISFYCHDIKNQPVTKIGKLLLTETNDCYRNRFLMYKSLIIDSSITLKLKLLILLCYMQVEK